MAWVEIAGAGGWTGREILFSPGFQDRRAGRRFRGGAFRFPRSAPGLSVVPLPYSLVVRNNGFISKLL